MGFVVLPLKSVASRGRRQRVICCVDGNGRWRLEVATAVETVRAASRVCLEVLKDELGQGTGVFRKDCNTPVTCADLAIQAIVSMKLANVFPEDGFVAEEDASPLQRDAEIARRVTELVEKHGTESGPLQASDILAAVNRSSTVETTNRFWVLDPIDGTKGFISGNQYIIGLALIENQSCTVSILGNPSRQRILVSIYDQGSTLLDLGDNDSSVDLEMDRHRTGNNGRDIQEKDQWTFSAPNTTVVPLPLGPSCPPQRLCCGSLVKYYAVAVGDVAGFIQYGDPMTSDGTNTNARTVRTWDHIAGWLAVTESGGMLTDGCGNVPTMSIDDSSKVIIRDGLIATAWNADHECFRESCASASELERGSTR